MSNIYLTVSLFMTFFFIWGLKKQNRLQTNKYTLGNLLMVLICGPGLLPYYVMQLKPYWNKLTKVNYPIFLANQSIFFKPKFTINNTINKKVYDFKPKKKFDFTRKY